MTKTPTLRLPLNSTQNQLKAYRDYLTHVGGILSGSKPLTVEGGEAIFYRTGDLWSWQAIAESRQTTIGIIDIERHAIGSNLVTSVNDPQESLTFLTSLLHLTSEKRRELALFANEQMENSNSRYATPTGPTGHLLKEFDNLIDQIKHEYHFQRQRIS